MTQHYDPDFEAAEVAADSAIEERYPKSTRPEWFSRAVFRRTRRVRPDQVEVCYRVERVAPLKTGYSWEESPSGRRLVAVDESTGKKWVVLTHDMNEFVDVFKVRYDTVTQELKVLVDEDIGAMDPSSLALDSE